VKNTIGIEQVGLARGQVRVRLSGACSKPLSAYRCGLPRLKLGLMLEMGPVVMRGGGQYLLIVQYLLILHTGFVCVCVEWRSWVQ